MNKDIYKAYKKAIIEIKNNDEIKANILYKDIWLDIIGQYVVAGSTHNTFLCFLDMYIERSKASENTKRILLARLKNDGFVLGLKKECPNAYGISKNNVISYMYNLNKEKETKEVTSITPFAETRSR